LCQRVRLERPCIIRRNSAESFEGVTRDIGRGGALITVVTNTGGRQFVDGEEIEMEIQLEANPIFEPKCIHCQGTVVRASWTVPEVVEIAIAFTKVEFRTAKFTGINVAQGMSTETTQ
jgi:hypothetical protein